jgi:hypothetical protein
MPGEEAVRATNIGPAAAWRRLIAAIIQSKQGENPKFERLQSEARQINISERASAYLQ